jgi:hypothetical protein
MNKDTHFRFSSLIAAIDRKPGLKATHKAEDEKTNEDRRNG